MSYITISRSSFNNNANYYSNLLGDKNKICIVLKDNAYGHGINNIAKLSCDYGIKHCMVRDMYEANIASEYNFESILVLYEKSNENINDNIIFAINSLDDLNNINKNTKIELKINTSMNRNGIEISQIKDAIDIINKKELILNGVFTHFHSADINNNSTQKQEKLFLTYIQEIKKLYTKPFRIHCSNSAGVQKINNDLYDIARLGIGMYGYCDGLEDELLPVLNLYANKISTRILNKDDCIGYGSTYKIEKNNQIVSNYDIGYGDGFFRINENKKAYISSGEQILGRVSMDSFSIFSDNNEVCVFNNASHLAKIHDTIEYEILTHLMPRIKRVIIE